MISTPKNCSECHGNARARIIIKKFLNKQCGHAECTKCGITFDTNVNEMLDVSIEDSRSIRNLDEPRYRELFVETSKIADENSEIYTDFDWESNDDVKRGVASHVLAAIDSHLVGSFKCFVDVGCGSGFMSREIAKKFNNGKIHAIDPSPLVAKLVEHPGIEPHQGTLQTAELDPGSADALSIIGNWMLHYNPVDTLEEANRVLRSQGLLIIDFKNVNSLSRKIAKYALMFGLSSSRLEPLLQRNFVNMRYGFNKKYVARLLHDCDFESVEVRTRPPRILEYANRSHYQSGIKGVIWRMLNRFDVLMDEQAWVQIVAKKNL